ncbi:MAG: Yip1 family protein [Anaerolineales bacterium]|nr:Yip1 family protein [Anaerolineales bacterium]
MSQFDNTPIMPSSSREPGSAGWLSVWIKAVTQPNEQTFIDITDHPDALPKTAYIWIFLVGTLSMIVSGVIQAALGAAGVGGQSGEGMGAVIGGSVIGAICISPVAGALSVLFFALGVAIMQWVAKLFGGTGSYDKLVYAMAAISVPVTLVSMLLVPFNAVPFLNICTGLLSIGLSFYALFLQITAVKAVNRFGWGQAAGSVLLPGLTILIVCGCIVIGGLMLMGPMIGDVFSEINQSLQFAP